MLNYYTKYRILTKFNQIIFTKVSRFFSLCSHTHVGARKEAEKDVRLSISKSLARVLRRLRCTQLCVRTCVCVCVGGCAVLVCVLDMCVCEWTLACGWAGQNAKMPKCEYCERGSQSERTSSPPS